MFIQQIWTAPTSHKTKRRTRKKRQDWVSVDTARTSIEGKWLIYLFIFIYSFIRSSSLYWRLHSKEKNSPTCSHDTNFSMRGRKKKWKTAEEAWRWKSFGRLKKQENGTTTKVWNDMGRKSDWGRCKTERKNWKEETGTPLVIIFASQDGTKPEFASQVYIGKKAYHTI